MTEIVTVLIVMCQKFKLTKTSAEIVARIWESYNFPKNFCFFVRLTYEKIVDFPEITVIIKLSKERKRYSI